MATTKDYWKEQDRIAANSFNPNLNLAYDKWANAKEGPKKDEAYREFMLSQQHNQNKGQFNMGYLPTAGGRRRKTRCHKKNKSKRRKMSRRRRRF